MDCLFEESLDDEVYMDLMCSHDRFRNLVDHLIGLEIHLTYDPRKGLESMTGWVNTHIRSILTVVQNPSQKSVANQIMVCCRGQS